MKNLKHYILNIKDLNLTEYIPKQIKFIKEIIRDKYTPFGFKIFLGDLLIYFNNKSKNFF